MKIKYTNNKNDNRLYSIFVEIFKIDYREYEPDEIDKLIIKDVVKLIDRITTSECKKILGKVGIKNYTDLKEKEVKTLLKEHLPEVEPEIILWIYKEHQVRLDMFKYEVCEVLNITQWRFGKIKHNLKISGKQVVNIAGHPKTVNKYDRAYIYELLLYETI
ncbi:hypothetical protein CHL78_000815 [Romboutsia weinsteinii]|uniref:Uncharacterized protein n=1 Tax=Romboutsia weinsteinii TaxID=2020949 RepID=A0A371JAK5_9FIRM|nr:hypothetical protein [Romboutsia weinsteinii]RDY29743.1 hypothetical protein CHL78_000815 [Romboutsia weinsteinii]